jgi:ribosomal protein S18 acetylase RimI-like enzyme
MPAPFRIRLATDLDVPVVIAMFGALDDQHSAGEPYQFRGSSAQPRTKQAIRELLENPDIAVLVAEADARVVGQTVVEIRVVPDDAWPYVARRYGLVHDLVVEPGLRRQGIGRALMAAADEWLRERDIDSVELNVWDFNEGALRLYESLGYCVQRVGWRRRALLLRVRQGWRVPRSLLVRQAIRVGGRRM